jgi:sortase (surface protein transpeptidase)
MYARRIRRIGPKAGSARMRPMRRSPPGPSRWPRRTATDEPTVTLITCYPFYFVGNAPQRFIVRAVAEDERRKF